MDLGMPTMLTASCRFPWTPEGAMVLRDCLLECYGIQNQGVDGEKTI